MLTIAILAKQAPSEAEEIVQIEALPVFSRNVDADC